MNILELEQPVISIELCLSKPGVTSKLKVLPPVRNVLKAASVEVVSEVQNLVQFSLKSSMQTNVFGHRALLQVNIERTIVFRIQRLLMRMLMLSA